MMGRVGDTQAVQSESPVSCSVQTRGGRPNPLVVWQRCDVGYGGEPVLRDINFSVQSGDRIGLLGVNGAGKSTLIKALTGSLPLSAGTRTPAQKLSIGYFAQHQVDQLRADHSPLQALQSHAPTLTDAQARNYLGGFGFNGDQALQSAATLSGGERARLALALIVQAKPNLLLLDEPTNHLDITMRQALADALVSFEGALLVISHDRTMLRSVVDELWLVADQSLTPFDDDLDGYARWLSRRRAEEAAMADGPDTGGSGVKSASGKVENGVNNASTTTNTETVPVDRRQQKREKAELRALLAPLNKAVARHEKQLETASRELAEIRERLGAEELYTVENKQLLNDLLSAEAEARSLVESSEEQLLESMEALEHATATHSS